MFEYIRGKLTVVSPLFAVVEAGGLGYKIAIPANSFSRFPELGEEVMLFLSPVIREDKHSLYGFLKSGERDLFDILLSVSGVGPKIALGVVGNLDPGSFHRAIHNRDISTLCKIPGVGKKTAERLVIEVRDKLTALAMRDPVGDIPAEGEKTSQTARDALSALVNLGYSQSVAQQAIRKAIAEFDNDPDLGALITRALASI